MITLADENKFKENEEIDLVIWAEIPDPAVYPELHEIVSKHMIHGPCSHLNPNSPCMIDGKCSKGFPKPFVDQTQSNVNGYPIYKRSDNGRTVNVRGKTVDNSFVVPYNPYMLKKYNART